MALRQPSALSLAASKRQQKDDAEIDFEGPIDRRDRARTFSLFSLAKDELELLQEREEQQKDEMTERIFMPAEDSISWMIQRLVATGITSGMIFVGLALGSASPIIVSMEKLNTEGFYPTSGSRALYGSAYFASAILGAVVGGPLSHRLGRKRTLERCSAPLFVLGFLLMGIARWFFMVVIGRAICGVAAGITTRIIPIYLTEIAAPSIRGSLGILSQLMYMVGMMIAFTFGIFMDHHWIGYASALLIIPYWAITVFTPESPAWLVYTGKKVKARKSVLVAKGKEYDVESELKYLDYQMKKQKYGTFADLQQPKNCVPVFIGVTILAVHGFGGPLSTLTWIALISNHLNLPSNGSVVGAIYASVQVLILVILTFVVDRRPRKVYLLSSAACVAVLLVAAALCFFLREGILAVRGFNWIAMSVIIGFMTFTTFGIGPLAWVVSTELLPKPSRRPGKTIIHACRWAAGCISTLAFPFVAEKAGMQYMFLAHAAYMVFVILVVIFLMPETKGKTEEEIEAAFRHKLPWLFKEEVQQPEVGSQEDDDSEGMSSGNSPTLGRVETEPAPKPFGTSHKNN